MKLEEGFLDFFISLEDPRSTRNRLYTMSEILLCTLSAAICGAEGWQDVEDFGNAKIDYLRQFIAYKMAYQVMTHFAAFTERLTQNTFRSYFEIGLKIYISKMAMKM